VLKIVNEGDGVCFQECPMNHVKAYGEVMPDGEGGWQPIPPLMNKREAILFLRLETAPNPERTLRYYREHGLKAVQIGKELRFTKKALDDFLTENQK